MSTDGSPLVTDRLDRSSQSFGYWALTAPGGLHTYDLTHVLHRDQADQLPPPQNRNCRTLPPLQALECHFDHLGCVGRRYPPPHDLAHRRAAALLGQSRDEVGPAKDPLHHVAVEDRKVLLAARP